MEQILREIHLLKLNQSRILDFLQLENPMPVSTSSQIPTPTPKPTPTPTTMTTPTPTTVTAITSASEEPSTSEDAISCPPATKKRRKTISKKYRKDEQKLPLYGGRKVHIQVKVTMMVTMAIMMMLMTLTMTTMSRAF